MKVSAADDIGNYAMFRSYYEDGTVTTSVSHVLWFPDKVVVTGDFVVLYSKAGRNNSKTNAKGTTSHFFYWHREEPLWKNENYAPVLLHVDRWESHTPSADP